MQTIFQKLDQNYFRKVMQIEPLNYPKSIKSSPNNLLKETLFEKYFSKFFNFDYYLLKRNLLEKVSKKETKSIFWSNNFGITFSKSNNVKSYF